MNNDIVNLRNCEKFGDVFEPEVLDNSERYCVECDPRLYFKEQVIDREE
jgi:hypothetical protein